VCRAQEPEEDPKVRQYTDELAHFLLHSHLKAPQELMMDENLEQNSEPAEAQTEAHGATRRRFLKGTTLALPAVVTLHTGTALANTSLGCGGQGNLTQLNVPVVVTTKDAYMRESVTLFPQFTIDTPNLKIRSVAAPTPFFFKGLSVWRYVSTGQEVSANEKIILNFLAPGTPPSIASAPVTNSTTITLGTQTYKFRGPTSSSSFTFANQGNGLALVNLNNTGTVVSVGAPPIPQTTYITSLSMACFTSLISRGQLT
jgi:hypothetical protein